MTQAATPAEEEADLTPTPELPTAPIVTARKLGLRTRRGEVFGNVTLAIHPGQLVAITGMPQSGRSSLLLALAGRFTTNEGKIFLPRQPWKHLALGYVPGVHELEPTLTLSEHVTERSLLLGIRGQEKKGDSTLARELSPYRRHLFCLELALLGSPRLIAIDDLDVGLTANEHRTLWTRLRAITDDGTAVVAVCRELPTLTGASQEPDQVYPLSAPTTASQRHLPLAER